MATSDITAAIAWFTDKDIYDLLCDKASKNVKIRVLLLKDSINTGQCGLDFGRLKGIGGQVLFVPNSRPSDVTMNHKFCVIDDKTVITGSYNWSKRARANYENATIIKGDNEFAKKYLEEFESILLRNGLDKKAGTRIGAQEVGTRLDLIKNLILIGDTEISSLKLELRTIEIEVNTLSNEKAEIERQILQFNQHHNIELGEKLTEYFRLRKEQLRRKWVLSEKNNKKESSKEKNREQLKTEYEKANREYEEYKDNYEASKKEKDLSKLNKREQEKIKKLYRKASLLCHPDKVAKVDQKSAAEVFMELQESYKRNDVNALQKILQYLQETKLFTYRSETITEKDSIKREITHLRRKVEKVLEQIRQLTSTPAWRTILSISDWKQYFDDQKMKLEDEINLLKKELLNDL